MTWLSCNRRITPAKQIILDTIFKNEKTIEIKKKLINDKIFKDATNYKFDDNKEILFGDFYMYIPNTSFKVYINLNEKFMEVVESDRLYTFKAYITSYEQVRDYLIDIWINKSNDVASLFKDDLYKNICIKKNTKFINIFDHEIKLSFKNIVIGIYVVSHNFAQVILYENDDKIKCHDMGTYDDTIKHLEHLIND